MTEIWNRAKTETAVLRKKLKKKNIRRINLRDLESAEEEELEEAEKLAVDMMARNGNSVDYLA